MTGTGGSNIYTTQYYNETEACRAVTLYITLIPCVDPPVVTSVQFVAPSMLEVTGSNFGAYASDLGVLVIFADYVTTNCDTIQLYNNTYLTCRLNSTSQRKRSGQPPFVTVMVSFIYVRIHAYLHSSS
jgi:hypothetical protein